ncbi:MAG: hypothetical protein M1812_007255 [Candelaria pacifica]|nr:MAG: hypothetical protein M1812_007255 [Candelaria pacifica]
MLQTILERLQNCKSFRVYSYGDLEEGGRAGEYLYPSDAVSIILSIVAEAGLPVKSFFVDFNCQGSLDGKRLQMQLYKQPTFIAAWANLEELLLDHYLSCGFPSATLEWARDLVLHAPCLKRLSLHFHNCREAPSFICSLLSSPVPFQGLQELKLACGHFTMDTFLNLLLRSRLTLRRLSFWFMFIESGTWKRFLTELRVFQHLEEIIVEFPSEYRDGIIRLEVPTLEANPIVPGSNGREFKLRFKKWKWARRVMSASFKGRADMDKALEILAADVQDIG